MTLPPDMTTRSAARLRRSPARSTTTPVTSLRPFARTGVKPRRWGMSASTRRSSGSPSRASATASTATPAARQVERGLDAGVAGADDDGLLAGGDPVLVDQPPHAAAQHHAGQVVALEHQRLLDHAGCDHDLAGPEAVHGAALEHRHQPALVDAAGPRRLQDGDAGRRGRRRPARLPGRPRHGRTRPGVRPAPGPRPPARCRGRPGPPRWPPRGRTGPRPAPACPRAGAPSRTARCGGGRSSSLPSPAAPRRNFS